MGWHRGELADAEHIVREATVQWHHGCDRMAASDGIELLGVVAAARERFLRDDPAAAKVLAAWLSTEREDGYAGSPHAPFEMSAVRVLRDAAESRVGLFLVKACKVLDAAEAARLAEIDDSFVDEVLSEEAPVRIQDDDEPPAIEADDDLL